MSEDTMVTIPLREYAELQEASQWLTALQNAGVDNWEGISFAHELYNAED